MHVAIVSLTDDPLDPPGADRYGGAQLFLFDLCRNLIRTGNEVTLVTRKSRPDKPDCQELGPSCRVRRFRIGPECETSHHDLWQWQAEVVSQGVALIDSGWTDVIFSVNWLSGLVALETRIPRHVHHILSLGRVRRELGEEQHPGDSARDAGEVEVFRHATRLICTCRNELSCLKFLYPEIDSAKAVVVPYPVNTYVHTRRPVDPSVFLCRKAQGLAEGA